MNGRGTIVFGSILAMVSGALSAAYILGVLVAREPFPGHTWDDLEKAFPGRTA
ncbi:hypothetical protein ACDF64_12110 [Agromyces sp. MMS24-JH15]|uniref:hypothetical protein n=1 Tax=Agromyces sp. MMS24-JH15 TaxID=3243765 RepID=UPI003748528F